MQLSRQSIWSYGEFDNSSIATRREDMAQSNPALKHRAKIIAPLRGGWQRVLFFYCVLTLIVAPTISAQIGIRGQIFLPNGAPPSRPVRFILTTDNGVRTDILFTDSNGRIGMPAITGPYTITVDSDNEVYDTTTASFDTLRNGNYIVVNLRPVRRATPPPAGTVEAEDVDQKVSPKAREAYESGLALIKDQKYEESIEPLLRAINIEKKYFKAHNDLAVVYLKLNKLDLAESTLRQAIKINNDAYLAHLNLGIVLNRQNKFLEAVDVLSKLQARHPELRTIRAPLIEALIGSRQWAEAEAKLKAAMTDREETDLVEFKIKLGIVQVRQNKFAEAAVVLKEAISFEPDNAVALFNLGSALLQIDKLDDAERALLQSYEIKKSAMAGAQLLLGQLYFQKKEYAKAINAFEAYLRDLPDAPNAAQVREAVRQLRDANK